MKVRVVVLDKEETGSAKRDENTKRCVKSKNRLEKCIDRYLVER